MTTSARILREIVNTDATANTVRQDCRQLLEDFDAHVEENKKELRNRLFAQADEQLAQAAEREKRSADNRIAALDEKLLHDISDAKERFEGSKEKIVDKIFKTAVGLDA